MIDMPFDKDLAKLIQLSEQFKQSTDECERSRLANEQLCLLENATLAARRYCSAFLQTDRSPRTAYSSVQYRGKLLCADYT